MPKAQRDKGRRGELEVAASLTDAGFDAELIYGQEETGGSRGDVDSLAGRFEVKRREGLPSWFQLRDDVRGVYVRRSRSPWLVVLRADDAERLMRLERQIGLAERSRIDDRDPGHAPGPLKMGRGAGLSEAAAPTAERDSLPFRGLLPTSETRT